MGRKVPAGVPGGSSVACVVDYIQHRALARFDLLDRREKKGQQIIQSDPSPPIVVETSRQRVLFASGGEYVAGALGTREQANKRLDTTLRMTLENRS